MQDEVGAAMYQRAILEHYKNPQHYGTVDPSTFHHVGENPLCGDRLEVTLLLDDDDRVAEARFTGQGCAISQAAADMFLQHIQGKTADEVLAFGRDEMIEVLGISVSNVREKCAVLAMMVVHDGVRIHRGELDAIDVTRTEE